MFIPDEFRLVRMDPDLWNPPDGTSPATGQDPKRLGTDGGHGSAVKWYEILVIVICIVLFVGLVVGILYLRSRKIKKQRAAGAQGDCLAAEESGYGPDHMELKPKTENDNIGGETGQPNGGAGIQTLAQLRENAAMETVDTHENVWRFCHRDQQDQVHVTHAAPMHSKASEE